MDGGESHSSNAKIKLIASVIVKKNMFLDLHLYEHLKLGRLWNNSIVFMTREGEKYQLVLYNFTVWITKGEHIYHTSGDHISKYIDIRVDWFLSWMRNDQILYHHNFATSQAIFKQKRLAWFPECVDFHNMKITCCENAWDFTFVKVSCSEFCMFYSIWHNHSLTQVVNGAYKDEQYPRPCI